MSLLLERRSAEGGAPAPGNRRRPRRRAALAVLVAAVGAAAVAAAPALVGGDAGAPEASGPLAWAADPLVFTPERLPDDRIAAGEVLGAKLREGRVYATRMVVVDADGRELETAARFLLTYSHGLYPPLQRPAGADESTQARLAGEFVELRAGQRAPLTVSWRLRPGARGPFSLSYEGGRLPIPGT